MDISTTVAARWLLLIHQIPPKPNYLRVKVARRLQRLGAVAIKNSVYALPRSDATHEQLAWLLREIVQGGGDGSICESRFLDGLTDDQIEAMFHQARDADYDVLAGALRQITKELPRKGAPDEPLRRRIEAEIVRLKRRLIEIVEIDFFGSARRPRVEGLISGLEQRLSGARPQPGPALRVARADYRGRTWVTRKGIHVDRMASAWLIRRFIDPEARLKFVVGRRYSPEKGELRFDMFDGEFTHEGDHCTFEVLLARMGIDEPGLRPIAEVVHDLDLNDGKYGRAEAAGIDVLIAAIALAHREDEERLERASAVFDDLYEFYGRKRAGK